MSIYGTLCESKTQKSNYKINNIVGEIEDELSELVIRSDIAIINSSYKSFLQDVAKEFFDYIEECRREDIKVKGSSDFASNFKSVKDVLKDIKMEKWKYFIMQTSSGKVIRMFYPYIDFQNPVDDHVPSIEAHVEDTGIVIDRIYFDG